MGGWRVEGGIELIFGMFPGGRWVFEGVEWLLTNEKGQLFVMVVVRGGCDVELL